MKSIRSNHCYNPSILIPKYNYLKNIKKHANQQIALVGHSLVLYPLIGYPCLSYISNSLHFQLINTSLMIPDDLQTQFLPLSDLKPCLLNLLSNCIKLFFFQLHLS